MIEQSDIVVAGDDAFDFLQGQLSNDLRLLESRQTVLAAWCSPKGRVIWFGEIRPETAGFALSAPAELAASVIERLTVFRFRSKVDFSLRASEETADIAARIAAGIPTIGNAQSELYTPHMLNLDLLDAVSLDKGCYTGQEIVARTHYKGATKRRTLRFGCEAEVPVGAKVICEGRGIGTVLNATEREFLAVVSTAKCGDEVSVGEVMAERLPIAYLA